MSEKKHAFLIIAHNEFEILELLVSSLDDERNDIYVHIDKKVRQLPVLKVERSRLFILENRVDVRWGNYSQIECEYLMWETASANGPYDFYHLISGTHLPLMDQDRLQKYFDDRKGFSLFSNLERRNGDYYEILKVHRINIFTSTYSSPKHIVSRVSQFVWKSFIAIQRWCKFTINDDVSFFWANNWCSLTQEAVDYLVAERKNIRKRYCWSFCGDEWFAPTELMNSALKDSVRRSDNLLFGTIGKSNAPVLTAEDYNDIISSGCVFGRKFSISHMDVVNKVLGR